MTCKKKLNIEEDSSIAKLIIQHDSEHLNPKAASFEAYIEKHPALKKKQIEELNEYKAIRNKSVLSLVNIELLFTIIATVFVFYSYTQEITFLVFVLAVASLIVAAFRYFSKSCHTLASLVFARRPSLKRQAHHLLEYIRSSAPKSIKSTLGFYPNYNIDPSKEELAGYSKELLGRLGLNDKTINHVYNKILLGYKSDILNAHLLRSYRINHLFVQQNCTDGDDYFERYAYSELAFNPRTSGCVETQDSDEEVMFYSQLKSDVEREYKLLKLNFHLKEFFDTANILAGFLFGLTAFFAPLTFLSVTADEFSALSLIQMIISISLFYSGYFIGRTSIEKFLSYLSSRKKASLIDTTYKIARSNAAFADMKAQYKTGNELTKNMILRYCKQSMIS